jgi:hypothetical protein
MAPSIAVHISGQAPKANTVGIAAATAGLLVIVNVKYMASAIPRPKDENNIIFFLVISLLVLQDIHIFLILHS